MILAKFLHSPNRDMGESCRVCTGIDIGSNALVFSGGWGAGGGGGGVRCIY